MSQSLAQSMPHKVKWKAALNWITASGDSSGVVKIMQRKWPFSYNYLDILGNIRPSYLGNYGFVDLTLQQTRLQLGFPWKMFALFGDKSGEGIHCFWNHMKSGFKETSVGSMPSRFPKSFSWPFGDGFIIWLLLCLWKKGNLCVFLTQGCPGFL